MALDEVVSGVERMLRLFVEGLVGYGVILLDPDGHVISWNSGAEAIKGFTPEQILGQHFSVFYPPEARAVGHPERELAAAAAFGQFVEEGWRVRADGGRFWAHVSLIAIYDEDELLGFGKLTQDLTERKQTQEQATNVLALLEMTSKTDFLTGVWNRRALDEFLSSEVATASRSGQTFTVVMLDLDRFKAYNDEHGHKAGDRYLRRAATAWRGQLRPRDILARYGGEEFTLILPQTDGAAVATLLERLRAHTPEPITFSAGFAGWTFEQTADQLIDQADEALRAAKKAGRDCFRHGQKRSSSA